MTRIGSLAAAGVFLVVSVAAPGATSNAKQDGAAGDAVAAAAAQALRARVSAREKTMLERKRIGARELPGEVRASEFASRASAAQTAPGGRTPSHGLPVLGAVAKADETPAKGTGGGDVFEAEPNDTTGQPLSDLPINVYGTIGAPEDWDCYAATVTAGMPVRVEVIADRVFGSPLDSYAVAIRDDGRTEIARNDDIEGSTDSFLTFDAPYSGTVYICVTDVGAAGGTGYEYVLNVSPAAQPDVSEREPNNSAANADPIPMPGIAFGAIEANGYDVFTFSGVRGETLVVDVDAAIFGSDMDALVGIYDDTFTSIVDGRAGGFLFVDDDDEASTLGGADPRFNIVLPYSGVFYLIVTDYFGFGGNSFYYSINISNQSGAGAPRVTGVKDNGVLMKKVIGSGFVATGVGSKAELNSDPIGRSYPAPRKPATQIVIKPGIEIFRGDVVTVVNPDGRRSNPGVL